MIDEINKKDILDLLIVEKGSTAKTHMREKRAQPQPAGPQRQAFRAGRGVPTPEERAQTRPNRPQGRPLGTLTEEWGENFGDVNLTDYDAQTESEMKRLLPDEFKKWYHSSKVKEARIQLMKMQAILSCHLMSIWKNKVWNLD